MFHPESDGVVVVLVVVVLVVVVVVDVVLVVVVVGSDVVVVVVVVVVLVVVTLSSHISTENSAIPSATVNTISSASSYPSGAAISCSTYVPSASLTVTASSPVIHTIVSPTPFMTVASAASI